MNKEDWKEFKDSRKALITKIESSDEYKRLTEKLEIAMERLQRDDVCFMSAISDVSFISRARSLLFIDVPEETLEGCLDWLIEGENG